jgi:hypothetical protein
MYPRHVGATPPVENDGDAPRGPPSPFRRDGPMPEHRPDFPFGFRLPTDVAAHIRATAATKDRPRRRRPAALVCRFDDRSAT